MVGLKWNDGLGHKGVRKYPDFTELGNGTGDLACRKGSFTQHCPEGARSPVFQAGQNWLFVVYKEAIACKRDCKPQNCSHTDQRGCGRVALSPGSTSAGVGAPCCWSYCAPAASPLSSSYCKCIIFPNFCHACGCIQTLYINSLRQFLFLCPILPISGRYIDEWRGELWYAAPIDAFIKWKGILFPLMFWCMNSYSDQLFYHKLNYVMYYLIEYDYSTGLEEVDLFFYL